jgi:hypothetical protein
MQMLGKAPARQPGRQPPGEETAMELRFMKWIEKNMTKLKMAGIEIEKTRQSPPNSPNSSFSVDLATKKCIGQIGIWNDGQMDAEALELESGETNYYEHFELDGTVDFTSLLEHYFDVLVNGTKHD